MNIAKYAEYTNDLIAFFLMLVMFIGYQLYLRRLARRDAASVFSTAATAARNVWVEMIMTDHGDALLAVQTLRNTSMAASFLASTAILLMVGALTLTGQAQSLQKTWHFLNVFGTLDPQLWLVKLLCLLLLLFYAFFNFINAIRVTNHVGYMITIKQAPGHAYYSHKMVASQLNRGSDFFRVGIRAYYYLVPIIFWLFGPLYMIAATAILVFVLLPKIDKTPPQFIQQE